MSTQVEFFPGVPVICTCSWQRIDISAVVVVACDDGRIRIWQVPDDLDCTLEDPQDYLIGKMQTRAMCTAGTSWLYIISVHDNKGLMMLFCAILCWETFVQDGELFASPHKTVWQTASRNVTSKSQIKTKLWLKSWFGKKLYFWSHLKLLYLRTLGIV